MKTIARIPLFTQPMPNGATIVSHINRNLSPSVESRLVEQGDSVIRMLIDRSEFCISLEKVPIEPEELAVCCTLSSWWPDASMYLTGHTCNLAIASTESGTAGLVDEAVLATHLAAAILTQTGAPGIYWGDGILNRASDFIELAAEVRPDNLNAGLWVNVKAYECDDGTFKLCTFGLAAFDLPDVEIDSFVSDNPAHVIGRVCELIERVLLGQVSPAENERVHWGDGEQLLITYGNSFMNPDDCVAKLHFQLQR